MTDAAIAFGPVLFVVLAVLTLFGAAVVHFGRLGQGRAVVLAAVRAVAQLAAVSLVITAILRSGWLTGLFVLVMFSIAALTSARRIGVAVRAHWVALALGAGVVPVLGLVLAAGVVPWKPIAVVPIAGIVIGGAMSANSQASRRALDELKARNGEYEAALALGFLPRPAALEICRPSAGQALIPALDQTRTVGLVTLPGAYVGVLLGGAGPLQAGVTQVLVLIGLLAAESVSVLVAVQLVASGRISRSGPAPRWTWRKRPSPGQTS
ncbi:ABC transporter permease [Amycolatopsis sp. H20-H5]|uniref:ABC transporter permease n=1 Tax=Amycolatopsis sp. H20-H5 TaxID=3046309 RepID=UPI002DB80615|nr:ABC transporter permease [Amycolatopsis sp. H20-H5]MEC3974114.1 ABC transporter permease [Amycolatopsis sp. H20-H5]